MGKKFWQKIGQKQPFLRGKNTPDFYCILSKKSKREFMTFSSEEIPIVSEEMLFTSEEIIIVGEEIVQS